MKRDTSLLFEKAKRSLKAAEVLFKRDDFDFAASRAYYAMFYAAEAALLEIGQTFSKHSGVLSGFYHAFVATKNFPQELHSVLHKAFEDRNQADYAFLDPFPPEETKYLLKNATLFLKEIEKLLKRRGY